MPYRLSQLREEHTPTGTQRVLQRIIPDLALNGRGLCCVGPLANKKSLADVKALSPCNKYAERRDGKPNAVVNDRQRQVDKDYHHRAKELDSGFGGDSSGGFEAELGSYGKRGKVLGPVVGCLWGDVRRRLRHRRSGGRGARHRALCLLP